MISVFSFFCFLFVWVRATLPRMKYNQLIVLCWFYLLPIAISLIVFIPSVLIAFDWINPLDLLLLIVNSITLTNLFYCFLFIIAIISLFKNT